MTSAQDRVELFMRKAGQEVPDVPTIPSHKIANLRISLISEELAELSIGLGLGRQFIDGQTETIPIPPDLVAIADGIADLLVVVLGTAVACGMKMEPIFKEVMDSNMTKFIDGHLRDDGKWIKGPSYKPAELKPILWDQLHPQ